MKLKLRGHEERYALEQLQLSLFPEEPMEAQFEEFTGNRAESALFRGKTWLTAKTTITLNDRTVTAARRIPAERETVSLRRRILQQSYYLAAVQLLPKAPAWGALAGVRPTKLSTRSLLSGATEAQADRELRDTYFVSPLRRQLCLDASRETVKAMEQLSPTDISLYIGIPFCPTRCAYCSFVSQTVGAMGNLLEPYLQALLKEIQYTGELLANSPHNLRTIYIGGGTPTTLSCQQLDRLLTAVEEHFDLSRAAEYTVEAGRPDTLSPEKLRVIYDHHIPRISINPQTMEDRVLRLAGRCHTAADVVRAFGWAKDVGFSEINMDLIAGLPGDSPEGFARSLSQVAALGPSNITVHTLAIKKGADLYEKRGGLLTAGQVEAMVEGAGTFLRAGGYHPYYLYRQKYMSGSFENVGWCREGSACLYNIYMMEEIHSILSLGGGGMSKVNLPGGRLERFHNPKFPKEYIQDLDTVLEKKRAFFARLDGKEE